MAGKKIMETVLSLFRQGWNVKGDIGKPGENPLNQGRLSNLTCTCQNHDRKLIEKIFYCIFVFPLNPHADILHPK